MSKSLPFWNSRELTVSQAQRRLGAAMSHSKPCWVLAYQLITTQEVRPLSLIHFSLIDARFWLLVSPKSRLSSWRASRYHPCQMSEAFSHFHKGSKPKGNWATSHATCRVRRDVDPDCLCHLRPFICFFGVHRPCTERDDPDCK